jgi:hypothetical protein
MDASSTKPTYRCIVYASVPSEGNQPLPLTPLQRENHKIESKHAEMRGKYTQLRFLVLFAARLRNLFIAVTPLAHVRRVKKDPALASIFRVSFDFRPEPDASPDGSTTLALTHIAVLDSTGNRRGFDSPRHPYDFETPPSDGVDHPLQSFVRHRRQNGVSDEKLRWN